MIKLEEIYRGKDFDVSQLDGEAKEIALVILKKVHDDMAEIGYPATGGGCRAFYSPKEWADRGEEYGLTSELIVVYDGGDLVPYFNLDEGAFSLFEAMNEVLNEAGYWFEPCTGWYSAVYKTEDL